MKSYSRKGHLTLVPTSSSVLALPASEEAGPMVRTTSVSAEAASTSSHGRPVFPSRCCPQSPRLPLLSTPPSTTTLALVAPVVPSPPPFPVRSTLPSLQAVWPHLLLLAHVTSRSHVSSHSHSPSAEDMSERSPGCITTDSYPRELEADETHQPLWLASLPPLPRECAPWLYTVRRQGAYPRLGQPPPTRDVRHRQEDGSTSHAGEEPYMAGSLMGAATSDSMPCGVD
jgi:hypothetical protein